VTLLEALLALVILGLSAVGYLEVFQGGARAIRAAEDWNRAAALAESTMERAIDARVAGRPADAPVAAPGLDAHVEIRPWRGRVDDIAVTVTLPDGRTLVVHRLVRSP
jgi:hypothetical protein